MGDYPNEEQTHCKYPHKEEQISCLPQANGLQMVKFENKRQQRSVSGSETVSQFPPLNVPQSPTKHSPLVIRALKRRTALFFIVYSVAVAVFVLSFLYYQHTSLSAVRADQAAIVLKLELSISDLRNGLSYLKLDLLESRARSNASSSSTPSGGARAGDWKSAHKCVPIDYTPHDRAIWSGSDSDRARLYSDLELIADHPCYRDAPNHLWRFAVALYYRAALLPSTVAATIAGGADRSATRTNQIAILTRANETINRARELTHHSDAKILKWCVVLSIILWNYCNLLNCTFIVLVRVYCTLTV